MRSRRFAVTAARASLLALVVLAGCKAQFESGVTVCGQTEPRCPAGFVCVNDLRCVKIGTDVSRADDGAVRGVQDAGVVPPFTPAVGVDAATVADAPLAPDAAAVASDMGATAIDAGNSADAAIVPAGQAVVKFCNGLRRGDGTPLELELAVGSLRFKATTRECTPAQGMPCTTAPAGPVTAQLFRDGMMVATREVTLDPSGQYLVSPGYDGTTKTYGIEATKLMAGQVCGNFAFPAVANVKFCNRLAMVDAMGMQIPVVLDLVVGTSKLTAGTGQCNTMDGFACTDVRAGQVRLSLQRNGKEEAFTMMTLDADGNYAVLGQFDPATKRPTLNVMPLEPGQTCAAYKPPPLPVGMPVADAGAGD
jgi:hypothetical protein